MIKQVKPEDFPKYLASQIFKDVESRFIAFEEKHGTRYFDAGSGQLLCQACLKILCDRHNEENGSWRAGSVVVTVYEEAVAGLTKPDHPEDRINELPPSLRDRMQEAWKSYKKEHCFYSDEVATGKLIVRAIKEMDPVIAYTVIQSRRDHEYEGYEIYYMETPKWDEE